MARARKPANLDQQLAAGAQAIIDDPASLKGRWVKELLPEARELRLDLGCGKGAFLARSAKANPDVLYVGMDISSMCIARCARKAVDEGIPNMVVARADASDLLDYFEPGELSLIHLNFNAPYPPKKAAPKRLTHIDHLARYRTLVGEDGTIELRTDNMPYWKWTLEELDIAGYHVDWQTEDLHAVMSSGSTPEPNSDATSSKESAGGTVANNDDNSTPAYAERAADAKASDASNPFAREPFVRSEYDEKLVEKGAVVYALRAHPGPAPSRMTQTTKLGLVDYLPDDLDELDHIPYGMEDTVFNMRNRKKNAENAQARKDWWERTYGSKRPGANKSKNSPKGVSCNKHEIAPDASCATRGGKRPAKRQRPNELEN